LIDRALSFKELSRADNTPQQFALTRTKDKKTRQDRYVGRILEMAAVKTTWVESLGQDSSTCWTYIENFNLREKFDKNTFWQNLSLYFLTNDNFIWQYHPIPFWVLKGFLWILTLSIFREPLIARCQKWIKCIYCANVKLSNNIWHCHKYKSIYYSRLLNTEYL
jgi:hypothetical protein